MRYIYWSLKKDVDAGDWHSRKIKDLRRGIQKGAVIKMKAGIITKQQYLDIDSTIKRSQLRDFSPLMFVIPVQPLEGKFVPAAVQSRANPLSEEYIITDLPRNLFDVLVL